MEQTINSLKKKARLAGFLYFILGITGFYGIMYVSNKVIVPGDTAATTHNILANEFLFRSGIASQLIGSILFLLLVLVLYRLFKQVNENQAKLMVALVLVQVPIAFLLETCNITSLMIVKGDLLQTMAPGQQQDLAMLFLRIHGYGIMVLEIFWGLWLIPLAQLVYKSGFIPRILGILLFLAGIGYTIDSLTGTLFPNDRAVTQIIAFTLSGIGELSMILWLLIKGVRNPNTAGLAGTG